VRLVVCFGIVVLHILAECEGIQVGILIGDADVPAQLIPVIIAPTKRSSNIIIVILRIILPKGMPFIIPSMAIFGVATSTRELIIVGSACIVSIIKKYTLPNLTAGRNRNMKLSIVRLSFFIKTSCIKNYVL
jgi:hypothetical protein